MCNWESDMWFWCEGAEVRCSWLFTNRHFRFMWKCATVAYFRVTWWLLRCTLCSRGINSKHINISHNAGEQDRHKQILPVWTVLRRSILRGPDRPDGCVWRGEAGWLRGALGQHWVGPSAAGSGGGAAGGATAGCLSQGPQHCGLLADPPPRGHHQNLLPSHLQSLPRPISVCCVGVQYRINFKACGNEDEIYLILQDYKRNFVLTSAPLRLTPSYLCIAPLPHHCHHLHLRPHRRCCALTWDCLTPSATQPQRHAWLQVLQFGPAPPQGPDCPSAHPLLLHLCGSGYVGWWLAAVAAAPSAAWPSAACAGSPWQPAASSPGKAAQCWAAFLPLPPPLREQKSGNGWVMMVNTFARGEQLQMRLVMNQLAAGWRFGCFGYVEMWFLKEKWKKWKEVEKKEWGHSEVWDMQSEVRFWKQRPLSCLGVFSSGGRKPKMTAEQSRYVPWGTSGGSDGGSMTTKTCGWERKPMSYCNLTFSLNIGTLSWKLFPVAGSIPFYSQARIYMYLVYNSWRAISELNMFNALIETDLSPSTGLKSMPSFCIRCSFIIASAMAQFPCCKTPFVLRSKITFVSCRRTEVYSND